MNKSFGVFCFIKFLVDYLVVWEELAIFVDVTWMRGSEGFRFRVKC